MEKILNNILERNDVCLICLSPDLEDCSSTNSFLWIDGDDEKFITIGDLLCYLMKKEKQYYSNMILCSKCTNNAITTYKFMLKCESNEKAMNKLLIGLKTITDMTSAGLTSHDKAAFMQIDTTNGKFNAFCDTQVMQNITLTLDRFKSILNIMSNNNTNVDDNSDSDETKSTSSSDYEPNDHHSKSERMMKYCSVCKKNVKRLSAHIDRIHRPKIFECTLCNSKYGSPAILRSHYKTTHGQGFPCYICGKMLKSGLKEHIASHSFQQQCQKCTQKFTSVNAFLAHQRRNNCLQPLTERQVINCNECEAKFTTKKALKRHFDFKHKSIARFKCDICSAKFDSKTRYDSHVRRAHYH